MESLKLKESNLKLRIVELEREVVQSKKTHRMLEAIAERAKELEINVYRLQHDLISTTSEGDEANKEVAKLMKVVSKMEVKIEEVNKEKVKIEIKMRELERKFGVLKVKEIEEKSKKKRPEEKMREKMSEKCTKIFICKKRIKELESQVVEKEMLKKDLRDLEEKVKGMERKLVELQRDAKEVKNVVSGLNERTREVINGTEMESKENGFKVQSPMVAIRLIGSIVITMAVVYVCFAKWW